MPGKKIIILRDKFLSASEGEIFVMSFFFIHEDVFVLFAVIFSHPNTQKWLNMSSSPDSSMLSRLKPQ